MAVYNMLNLSLDNNHEEIIDLVAINVTLTGDKKIGCYAYGCSGELVKKYVLDKEISKSSKFSIAYRHKKSINELHCIGAVERELQDIIGKDFQELHKFVSDNRFSRSKKDGSDDNLYTPIVHIVRSIRILIDHEEKAFINNINDFPYVRISMVVRSGRRGAFIIAQGYKNINQELISWLKEEVDNNCELTIELDT